MRTLYAIWGGSLTPLSVGGHPVTLTQAQLVGSWSDMCSALNVQINAAVGEAEINWDDDTGYFTIWSVPSVDWSIDPGFAEFCGFNSASYTTNASEVVADSPAPYRITGQRFAFDLPIQLWLREMRHLDPVVWRGPLRSWEVRWTVPYAQDFPFDPRRDPFIVSTPGSTGAWDFDNRSGWVAMRPLGDAFQRRQIGRKTRALGEYSWRCADMGVIV